MSDAKLEILLTAKDVTSGAFKSVEAQCKELTSSVFSLNTVLGTLVGVAGFGALAKVSMDATAEMQKNATMAGVSTEAYQELTYAAGQYMISQDALTDGMKELALRTDEYVQTAGGSGKESFERLGFTQADLNKRLKDTPGLLREVIKRMEDLDTAAQIRIADELFGGTGGEQFVAMIDAGADALDGLTKEARALGVVMSDDLIKQSIQAKKEIDSLTTVLSSQFQRTIAELAPDIKEVAEYTGDWVKNNRSLIQEKVPEYVGDIRDTLKSTKAIYDSIPDEIKGPAGMGIVGATLLGGKAGKAILVLGTLNNTLKSVNLDLGHLADTWERGGKATQNILDVLSGKRDWNTGELKGVIEGWQDYKVTSLDTEDNGSSKNPPPATPPPSSTPKTEAYRKMVAELKKTQNAARAAQVDYVDSWELAYRDRYDVAQRANQAIFDLEDAAVKSYSKPASEYTDSWLQKAEGMEAAAERATDILTGNTMDSLEVIEYATTDVFSSMEEQWVSFCTGGAVSFSDFAKSVVADIARITFQENVTQPMGGAVSTFVSGLFNAPANAQGNAFDQSGVQAYAQGGAFTNQIVSEPTMFAHGGGFGVMGEDGPEAIVPLKRMPSGNMGVEFQGSQTQGQQVINHYHITVNALDAPSVQALLLEHAETIGAAVVMDYKNDGVSRSGLNG
jgi:lambda family phage tail tape measure protein